MGDSEVEVAQMMLELMESKDFPNHSPVASNFNMLEQHTVVDRGSGEQ
jgi:hypothetical protein